MIPECPGRSRCSRKKCLRLKVSTARASACANVSGFASFGDRDHVVTKPAQFLDNGQRKVFICVGAFNSRKNSTHLPSNPLEQLSLVGRRELRDLPLNFL